MKKLILAAIIFIGFSCTKTKAHDGPKTPEYYTRCGTIIDRPTLDSFVSPTYYITTLVAFPEGDELVHIHGTADQILPPETIHEAHWIKGGEHIMIYNRADEVSALINEHLAF